MKNRLVLIVIVMILSSGCAKKSITGEKGDIAQGNGSAENVTPPGKTGAEEKGIVKGNSVADSGINDVENHTGLFEVTMSGYRGEIFIGVADGVFYGTIKFFNWGNGVPQPLKDLRVNEEKVYFVRSITTREEIDKYGGTATFRQEFYGIFSKDKKLIGGYYRYAGTQDNWEAVKK